MNSTRKIFITVATVIAISVGMMPTFPANAANGEITCGKLISNNGFRVVASQGSTPVYVNGQLTRYRYVYQIQNRRGRVSKVACLWNVRRDSARLIFP